VRAIERNIRNKFPIVNLARGVANESGENAGLPRVSRY
jgi:hypothetical protein